MKYGVIDIGSNTIKAFVYDTEDDLSVRGSMHKASKLINYIENSVMTDEGISVAVNDISELKAFLETYACENIFAFATSATRDCTNSDAIIKAIEDKTKLKIDLLSGKAEALCDAKAAKLPGEEHFVCIDLGGGSAQICEYKDGTLTFAESRPIGALRTKKRFAGKDFPDKETKDKVIEYINDEIAFIHPSEADLNAVVMGGASQSSKKIKASLGISDEYDGADVFMILYDKLCEIPYDERMELLKREVPLRAEILGYALIILDTITKHCKINRIYFMTRGSREGYLLYKLEGMDFSAIC
ncbi:MAG: hypothetical protein E7218_06110 [Anaerofustis stercorihominis]|nr:hypothetical protein [Anaerofustis stercorihominis]